MAHNASSTSSSFLAVPFIPAFSAAIDTLSTYEILHEMLDHVEHTNGLEFCDSESMLALITAMVEELAARAGRGAA